MSQNFSNEEALDSRRRPGSQPERSAHFAKIQTKPNSQYAIKKTGINSGSDRADEHQAPTAILFCGRPGCYKNEETNVRPNGANR